MRYTCFIAALLLVACDPSLECYGPDDCADGERCAAHVCVAEEEPPAEDEGEGGDDDPEPDPEPDPDPDPVPDGPIRCEEGEAGPGPECEHLLDFVDRARFEFGGAPRWRELVALDLDGDPEHSIEHVVVRGGRVEVRAADGALWWHSGVVGARRVEGVVDLDGDGPLEVVVSTGRSVHVYAGLDGRHLWTLPERPFGEERAAMSGVHRVMLDDVNGDGLPDLYAADSGCGGAGSGDGVFHTFARGFDGETRLGVVREPRCARYQVLADVDGDGGVELVTPDSTGLHAVDPVDGARRFCGDVEPGNNGTLSTLVADLLDSPGDELVTLRRDRISVVDLVEGATEPCAAPRSLRVVREIVLGRDVRIRAAGSAIADVDGDGALDIVTSGWFPGFDVWCTLGYGVDGELKFMIEDAVLLATQDLDGDGRPELLVATGQGRAPARQTPVQLYSIAGREPVALWQDPPERASVLADWPTGTATSFSPDLAQPVGFRDAVVLLVDAVAPFDVPEQLQVLGVEGGERMPLDGTPGAAHRFVDPNGQRRDLLALALSGGRLGVFDARLNGGVPVRAPSGAVQLVSVDARSTQVVAYNVEGTLAGIDPSDVEPAIEWTTRMGVDPRRPQAALPAPARIPHPDGDLVLVRDHRDSSHAGWAVVNAIDGSTALEVGYDASDFKANSGGVLGVGDEALVITYDLFVGDGRFPLMGCDRVVGDLEAPDAACGNRAVLPRTVTAWRLDGGGCAWRAVLRPNTACGGPAGQTMTIEDGVVYITESNALRAIDGATGELLATADLGRFDPEVDGSSAPRGGGRVLVAGDRLLRVGGNGPVDAFDRDLGLVWRAEHPADLDLQAWARRGGVVVGDELWVSPGAGQPLHRYAARDGALRGRLWLRDGAVEEVAPPGGRSADVRSLQRAGGLVLVTTDDGFLYGFDEGGGLVDATEHAATPGAPLLADVDGDGEDDLLVPTGDGVTVLRGCALLDAPGAAWDVVCPPSADLCHPEHDIDVTESEHELCAMFYSVPDATHYDTRVLGPNGGVVRPWAVRGGETFADYAGLELVPGSRYSVEVRAWRIEEGELAFSGVVSATDGVLVQDPSPPEITLLSAAPNPVPRGGRTTIVVEANDDDRVAGWSLAVHDADGLVVRLVNGQLAHPEFRGEYTWDGTDRAGERLVGDFTLVARVVDRAGSEAAARAPITLCDDDC